jgi:Tfp pilus assembly protein PilZ
MSSSKREQRKTPRVQPYVTPCRVLDGQRRFSGYVVDLSAQGAQVCVQAEPPQSGSVVVLQVRLGGRAPFMPLTAEVRWFRPPATAGGVHAFGVTFKDMEAEQRERLEAALAEFRRRAAELV